MTNNTFIKNLNIFGGKIVFDDFDIDEQLSFEKQKFSYKEDILQIEYGDRFLIDVGWYPEMEKNGCFTVRAIQDYDWSNPLSKMKYNSLIELKKAIEETAQFISQKCNE